VNCSERNMPPNSNVATIRLSGVVGVNKAMTPTNTALRTAFTVSTWRNPNRRRMIGMMAFIVIAPTAFDNVMRPD
jgi:hypothetical protein